MKNTRKFAAMIAALTLSACSIAPMAMTASAEATAGQITFTGEQPGTHSYNVYKIFNGEAAANGMNGAAELNDLSWAVNEDVQKALVTALKESTVVGDIFDKFSSENAPAVADFAAVVGTLSGLPGGAGKTKAFAQIVVNVFTANNVTVTASGNSTDGITLNTDGYYVIAETGVSDVPVDDYTGMTAYLLGVYDATAGAKVIVKSSVPSFQKKLKDTNDTTGETTGWQDSADYDIGDDVPFQLKATLPSTYANYKAYKLTFHDNFRDTAGEEVFTFKQIDKVYVDGNNNGVFDDGDVEIYYYTSKQDATTKKADATYNMEVEIANLKTVYGGATPEIASVIVEYTATLNDNAVLGSAGNLNDAYLSYTTNPNWNGKPDTADTPDEEKEQPKDSPIDTTVVFTYQTVINKINPQGEALTGAEFTLEKEIKGVDGGENTWEAVEQVTVEGETSTFTFKGLDDGNYRLTETKAPTNYKKATKPVYFTISAVHTNDSDGALELTSLSGAATTSSVEGFDDGFINLQLIADSTDKISSDKDAGEIEASFINTSGAELPSTGGIGTKIFYLGGGAMVAVAGVFLITKKRMGKSEN